MREKTLSVYRDKHVGRCDRCKKWQGKRGGHTADSNLGTEFDDGSGRSLCPKCWKEVYDAADDATKARMKP